MNLMPGAAKNAKLDEWVATAQRGAFYRLQITRLTAVAFERFVDLHRGVK